VAKRDREGHVPETLTSVPTAAGDLRAIVHAPEAASDLPGVVLVDGSGDGTADGWDTWPETVAGFGAVVLSHDKPGCGDSPGDWKDQSFEDRARETLAAVEVLRGQPGVDPSRVGLLGISQGGWVSYLAASMEPAAICQLVSISGPGVSVAEQERFRIASEVGGDPEAMAWVDERSAMILGGRPPEEVLAAQRRYASRLWFQDACGVYDIPELLPLAAKILGFDPAMALRGIRCPVFAVFGGADETVPVSRSVSVLSELLPPSPRHALAVFPGVGHNLFVGDRDPDVPMARQLAPGFLPMLDAWLQAN
jgi:uncharacterized protein